jgi:2-methylcitrate dehydratase PrpD
MTTQEVLSEFIVDTTLGNIDPLVVRKATDTIADTLGVALGGSTTELAESIWRFTQFDGASIGDSQRSLLIGRSERTSATSAALHNGSIGHALDYDDVSRPSNGHLSGVIVPATLAVTADAELLGEQFLSAYAIGFEVAGTVGRVLTKDRRGKAWHPTSVVGPIGAAAAAAKMLGLDRKQVMNALAIAATSASGLRANFGSMTKPLHAGRGAQAGVMAALLAQADYTAAADALDGPTGFFQAFGTLSPDEIASDTRDALAGLGRTWVMGTDMGIMIKPYPSCAQTHPGIEAALLIREKVHADEIQRVRVGVSERTPASLTYHHPERGLQGKFSMEYCLATALSAGEVSIDAFTDSRVAEPSIQELMSKIIMEVDDLVRNSTESAAVVEVTTTAGAVFRQLVEVPKGNGLRWPTPAELHAKFVDCAGRAIGAQRATELFTMLERRNVSESAEAVTALRCHSS